MSDLSTLVKSELKKFVEEQLKKSGSTLKGYTFEQFEAEASSWSEDEFFQKLDQILDPRDYVAFRDQLMTKIAQNNGH